jgi:hypothetical protein
VSPTERTRTPELVVLALIALLVAGALVLGGGSGAAHRATPNGTISSRHIALVERRVERLRGLRFLHPVPVRVVSPAQARAIGLAEDRRAETPAERAANEELLKLVGLLRPHDDLERIDATVLSEQVAGFYDPRTKQLALVRGAGVDDITLAHELTHALEDQHFGIARLDGGGTGDAATAGQALVEGSATELMLQYAIAYPRDTPSIGAALGDLGKSVSGTPLPPAVMRELLFPYEAGEKFVAGLLLGGGRDWSLVNNAERYRPPVSSAEILHPRRWVLVQRPTAARVADVGRVLGTGWRRVLHTTLGEQDTRELLHDALGARRAAHAAAGWRGGTAELWRRSPLPDPACAAPCRRNDALTIAWRVAGPAASGELGGGLGAWLVHELQGQPLPGRQVFTLPDGSSAAITTTRHDVRLALAPSRRLAIRLAV